VGQLGERKSRMKNVLCEIAFFTRSKKGNIVELVDGLSMVLATFDEEELWQIPIFFRQIVVKFLDCEAIRKYLFPQNPN
jgi:hypothetical protein